jgi:MFS family permease
MNPPTQRPVSTFSRIQPWLVVFSAALFFFFEFINMNSFNAFNDELRLAFHVDATSISNLSAMYFYANVLFLIPAGLLLDWFSTRKLLIGAITICIISTYVFASTDSFLVAKICRFITGMGSTLCLLSCALLTSRWFKPNLAALVIGLVVTMAMLGGIVAQQIVGLEHLLGGWRHVIMGVATLGIVFLILIALFVKDYPKTELGEHVLEQQILHQQGFWRSFGLALSNIQTWMAGLYTNFLSIPVIVLGALWGKDYLMVVHHLADKDAVNVTSMIFLGMLIGSPLFGWISDFIGRRKPPMIIGAILTLMVVLLILYIPNLTYHHLIGLFFLLGLFSGSQVITYALVIESNPKHITASSESLSATLIMSAGAIFQPLFGWIMDKFWDGTIANGMPIYSVHAYSSAMMMLPITFVVSIVLSFIIKETYCRETAA